MAEEEDTYIQTITIYIGICMCNTVKSTDVALAEQVGYSECLRP